MRTIEPLRIPLGRCDSNGRISNFVEGYFAPSDEDTTLFIGVESLPDSSETAEISVRVDGKYIGTIGPIEPGMHMNWGADLSKLTHEQNSGIWITLASRNLRPEQRSCEPRTKLILHQWQLLS